MQVVAFAREKCMLFDVENHVQVARWTAEHSGLTISAEANAGAVLDTSRNLGLHRALTQHATLSLALGARIGDDAAHALAGGAGTRHGEESLLITDLAAPLAGTTGDWRLPGCGA